MVIRICVIFNELVKGEQALFKGIFQIGSRVCNVVSCFQQVGQRMAHDAFVGNGILLSGQKLLKIKRNQDVHFTKGSNWFSCTDGFARYLLTKEEWVLQVLDKTFCSDEFFVQTLIAQSPYQDKIYQGPGDTSARAIDWDRGNPWVWKYADLEQLKASPCMFARKFDIEKEPELVHEIERLYAPHI